MILWEFPIEESLKKEKEAGNCSNRIPRAPLPKRNRSLHRPESQSKRISSALHSDKIGSMKSDRDPNDIDWGCRRRLYLKHSLCAEKSHDEARILFSRNLINRILLLDAPIKEELKKFKDSHILHYFYVLSAAIGNLHTSKG